MNDKELTKSVERVLKDLGFSQNTMAFSAIVKTAMAYLDSDFVDMHGIQAQIYAEICEEYGVIRQTIFGQIRQAIKKCQKNGTPLYYRLFGNTTPTPKVFAIAVARQAITPLRCDCTDMLEKIYYHNPQAARYCKIIIEDVYREVAV